MKLCRPLQKAGTAPWPPGHSARDIPDATVPQEKGVIRLFYSLDDSIRSPAYRYKARSSILNGLMMLAVDRNTLQAAGSL